MTDREYQILKDWMEEDGKKEKTREERLRPYVAMGMLDENGNYTKEYEPLREILGDFLPERRK